MNRSLVLLSGEGTSIPLAEAKALFQTYDSNAEFYSPHVRLLVARSSADPFRIGSRIAFARRVGILVDDIGEARDTLRGKRVRFREFDLAGRGSGADPESYLAGVDSTVDLASPDFEVTLVRADIDYLALTTPSAMEQRWSQRRPRRRAYFHPSAIFPKLSRALFNLSRCGEGGLFLDPFAGTGSIPIEAAICGAEVVASDQSSEMVRGSLSNMRLFGQRWLGVLRSDATSQPLRQVDAIATDMPYGRASSTRGRKPAELLESLLPQMAAALKHSSYLVLMHPQALPVDPRGEFSFVEEHHLHVHKLLTRTITVLRRR